MWLCKGSAESSWIAMCQNNASASLSVLKDCISAFSLSSSPFTAAPVFPHSYLLSSLMLCLRLTAVSHTINKPSPHESCPSWVPQRFTSQTLLHPGFFTLFWIVELRFSLLMWVLLEESGIEDVKIVWNLRRVYTIKWHVWVPVHQVY